MNNLKDIHNFDATADKHTDVVLSGFQRYFCMQYTTSEAEYKRLLKLFYQDVNEQFCCKSTEKIGNMQIYTNIFCYFNKKYYLCTNKFEGYTQ